MPPTADQLVLVGADVVLARSLARLAPDLDLELASLAPDDVQLLTAPPLAVVIDLEADGALSLVSGCKARWPATLVAGFVVMPDDRTWRAAEEAGCDVVASRGALAGRLAAQIPRWRAQPGGRRLPLLDVADLGGRLGVVQRLETSPVGPLAIYHLGGRVYAAGDACPHAGATLSEGELAADEGIITCPRHGSRFDVRDGTRVRGPADDAIPVYRTVVDAGRVFVVFD